MRKKVLLIFLFVLVFSSFFIAAANETVDDKAYECLEDKVEDNCDSLSFEEQIFSLLAIGECEDEVLDDSDYMSDTKLTALAILALDRSGVDTDEAEEWLISQNSTPSDMDWLLQIESSEAATCAVTYGGSTSTITLNEDKTVSGATGCLSIYEDYWMRIDRSCYGEEFTISCDESFLTNLLYKKTTGINPDTLHILEGTHQASSGGTTTEKVNSFCFTRGTSCNYETTLWAAFVLDTMDYDVSSFLPYLVTMMDETENKAYLPESFLYFLTNDFYSELLSKQRSDKWWLESGDKYYDTAVALLPFQGDTITQKTNTINWLSEVQDEDGCWDTNTRNIAFILYSIWPRRVPGSSGTGGDEEDCEDAGYYCMSPMSCSDSGGSELESYDCFGSNICCTKEKALGTCSEQGGKVCDSDEECSVSTIEASDTFECCVGSCREPAEKSECEIYADGNCRTSCYSNEKSSDYECPSGNICCVEKQVSAGGNYWWIWVLIILIILTILGIIFRKNLKIYLDKIKSKFGKFKPGSKPGPKPRFPPTGPGAVPQRPIPRRILPPSQTQPLRRPIPKQKGEIDDVLKKLKEMGK